MQTITHHGKPRLNRCIGGWRLAVARLMAFVLVLFIVMPPLAADTAPRSDLTIVTAVAPGEETGSADAFDAGLVQHSAHCPCHQVARCEAFAGATVLGESEAVFPARDRLPAPRPSSPPLKPPRA